MEAKDVGPDPNGADQFENSSSEDEDEDMAGCC